MNNYSLFQHYVANIGNVQPNSVITAVFKFEPIVENTPKYLFTVPSCGCISNDWNSNDNTLTVKWSVGTISKFHSDLGMTELPQEKTTSVFIEEHGLQKEHVLTIKLKIVT